LRLLNDKADKKLDNITIFLTKKEAIQLKSYLTQLLSNADEQHAHLASDDYQKEITVCLYDETDLSRLHPRAIKLIKDDV